MKTKFLRTSCAASLAALALASAAALGEPRLALLPESPHGTKPLPAHITGRITAQGEYQWPGLYFEAKFKGPAVYFRTGPGDVILQVRFAEVNRRVMTELGVSLFTGATGNNNNIGRLTTGQFSAPTFDKLERTATEGQVVTSGEITFGDFLNLFIFNTKYNVGVLIKALQSTGFFQSLAEPNLIAYNGQDASFLAGGEIPVPVVQGATGTVTVEYKEFGIRLNFRPTIAGDVIRLKVRPEVSTLDFGNGITLSGFRIPALSTRRAETDVELRDGQSFVIAGLLDNVTQDNAAEIPLLSKIPIIGYLFKSKAERSERTELMVLITPRLVQPLDPDEVPPLPTRPRRFLPPPAPDTDDPAGGTVDAPAKAASTKAKK